MVVYDHYAQLDTLSSFDITVAGAVSGVLTRAVSQPLDVLKIRFQLQVEPLGWTPLVRVPNAELPPRSLLSNPDSVRNQFDPFDRGLHPKGKYTSIPQALRLIVKEEGVVALWKGHMPAQALSLVFGMVQFTMFERVKQAAPTQILDEHGQAVTFVAGAISGMLAGTAALPLDVLRTRLVAQGNDKAYHSVGHAFRNMYHQEGTKAFFRGFVPTVAQIAPFSGFQFMFYHVSKNVWDQVVRSTDVSKMKEEHSYVNTGSLESLVCGALAGTGAKLVVYPLDMLKKRLQVIGFEHARTKFGATPTYHGLMHCIRMTLKQEGAAGMFKGLAPALLKAAVVSGVGFFVYDQMCNLIRDFRNRRSRSS